MKFENMSEAELDARLKALAGKVSTGEKEMIPQEKVELARLLEERMFRCEPGFKLELVRKIIGGVERTILVVKLKLRPPGTVER
jgi:hypothetical protein